MLYIFFFFYSLFLYSAKPFYLFALDETLVFDSDKVKH